MTQAVSGAVWRAAVSVAAVQTYGSEAFRSLTRSTRSAFADDGRTLLLCGLLSAEPTDVLQAMDAGNGAVVGGDRVIGFVPVGDLVVAALTDDRSTLGVYRIRDLAPVRTVPVGVPADDAGPSCLAAGGGTVAMRCGEPATVVLLDTGTWQARPVDLPARPTCLTVGDDGALVVVGAAQGRTGRVVVVDAVTGTVRHVLTGPRTAVGSVAVRGDLVVASAGNRVLAWTLPPATGTRRPAAAPKAKLLHTVERVEATVVGITPGGLVLVHDRSVIAAVDPVAGQVVWSADRTDSVRLAGERLICAQYGEVRDRDPESGTVRQSWPVWHTVEVRGVTPRLVAVGWHARVELLPRQGDHPAGHDSPVRDVSFDGERFATAADDRWVFVWSRGRAEPVAVVDGFDRSGASRAVHLTGAELYTSYGGSLQRWSLDGPARTATLSAESGWLRARGAVTLIRPLPGSGLVLVATEAPRRSLGELILLDATTLSTVDSSPLDWTLYAADPLDERRLLLRGDHHTVEYDTVARRRIAQKTYTGRSYARLHHLYPDRSLLVEACRGWLAVTDLSDGSVRHDRIETEQFTGRGDLSGDGRFATPHPDAIRLWDLDAGKVVHELPAPPSINRVWWFPDGETLLVCTDTGALHEVAGPRREGP
ncbi:WD40 repeat domain-containing protein [Dactylosporangium sp. CA-233914]|uniref:WD40 repeat domain-containing protein n=1 Tax=Dactylosporangium sp. CA-233914 TaxID=3239934 RepID=UPI003D91A175